MHLAQLFKNADRSEIEKWCRAHTQQAYLGEHTALCRVLGNLLMYVDTRDLSLTPHMLMNGFWEIWVTQAIAAHIKPGMRCLDIGANVGYYTLLLAELVGPTGNVVSYEPQTHIHHLLVRSKIVNGMPQVETRFNAVSNADGVGTLHSNPTYAGSAALVPWLGYHAEEVVSTVTIDAQTGGAHGLPVDFVKIDVQGHEMAVLEGMKETIRHSPKIAIAMEFSPSEHPDPKASFEQIQAYGLIIKTIGTDGVVRPVSLDDAARADTGDHRMLWLDKSG